MTKTSKASSAKKASPKKASAKKATATTSSKKSTTKTSTSRNTNSKSTRTKMVTKTRTQSSVENGIKILQTAIKGKLSLSEASRRNSFGRNYLSDVKARIKENYRNKKIDRETYQNFSALLKTYNSL